MCDTPLYIRGFLCEEPCLVNYEFITQVLSVLKIKVVTSIFESLHGEHECIQPGCHT